MSSMASNMEWPGFNDKQTPMEQLVLLSRYYGSDTEMVIAGGGNTSVKDDKTLWVKGSGTSLAVIDPDGFVEMDRAQVAEILTTDLGDDPKVREEGFKDRIMAARIHPEKGQRPSVECTLHNLLPSKFVVHTHSTTVNKLTCTVGGEALAAELLGDDVLWIPYVDPGYVLAKVLDEALAKYQKASGKECPAGVLMDNHGLIICGETPDEVKKRTQDVLRKIQTKLDENATVEPFGPVSRLVADDARRLVTVIGPALRGLLAQGNALPIVTFDDSEPAIALACGANGKQAAMGGPLSPDQIVYCTSYPLWFEPKVGDEAPVLVEKLRGAIEAHKRDRPAPPKVILVQGVGVFAVGPDYKSADTTRTVYLDAAKVMGGATQLGGVDYLTDAQRTFIEDWEVEAYRQKVAAGNAARGRAAGKVIVVTGAAQGFGYGIAEELSCQGGHVVLADINVEGVEKAAETLAAQAGGGRACGVAMNVADEESIAEALYKVVRRYGGFDAFIANAGVLKAESVMTQPRKDFEFVTDVNYVGYFLCTQAAARVLANQYYAKPDVWSDIIQINSKSGLQGSNKNAAYAGGKFGGIGLTQSFAMELVEYGIKVNSVCPGNFFDGPLWSHPEKGLFAQYLRTGKVPGAKTIEDVKHAYEEKVPMRRGCTVIDVVRAICYIIEQDYETGQALPVTGGQVMLR